MPTYEYKCTSCAHQFEKMQKITEDPLIICPSCSKATLQKVLHPPPIVFKGQGWYINDSKTKTPSAASPASSTDKQDATNTATTESTPTSPSTSSENTTTNPKTSNETSKP